MKKFIAMVGFFIIILTFSGCATLNEMKGTYVSFTPLVDRAFDYVHYETISWAYTPETADGKLFKRELSAYLRGVYFKIADEKTESDAVEKTGLKFNGTAEIKDAQKFGKIMKTRAVIIVNKADFSVNGKAENISLDIIDTYGGVLVRAVYRGGNNPLDIESAAKSIVNGIGVENMKLEQRYENDDKRIIMP